MTELKEETKQKMIEVVAEAFGNRCSLCGSYFDEGNICNNGHELGETYIVPQ